MRIKMTVGKETVYAEFENNQTTQALIKKMPFKLTFFDLFRREKCHNFRRPLPVDHSVYRGYEVGEIIYWPPMRSFVVMYAQNGERLDIQSIGKIEGDVKVFSKRLLRRVKFEVAE